MAGSLKTVLYVADDGTNHCIKVDESNIELIMGAQVAASGSYPALPKGTSPRFVRLESQDGKVKRQVPVLTSARYLAIDGATAFTLGAGDPDSGTAVRIRTKKGEENRFIPRDYDTGKTDGDAD